MWICTRCAAHQKAEGLACSICGSERPIRSLASSEKTPAVPSLIPVIQEPELRTPWTRKGVEAGMYIGTALALVLGVIALFNHQWVGGLICIIGSPVIGLLFGVVLAYLVESFEDLWYTLAGGDRPPPVSIDTSMYHFLTASLLMVLGVVLGVIASETDRIPRPLQGILQFGLMTIVVAMLCLLPMYVLWRRTRGTVVGPLEDANEADKPALPESSSTNITVTPDGFRPSRDSTDISTLVSPNEDS